MIQLVHYDPKDGTITSTFRFIGPEEEEQMYAQTPNTLVVDDLNALTAESKVDLDTLKVINLKQVTPAKDA